ncbi:hypothetical protein SCP_0103930 [Sparassis crispa]|uniref:Uncharacterized protein n=1 Tax=Sparassis crispa TaxID=139825 RepID=A0A401G5S9_9APHY|nr:hypothetical protein SCP_0103930 [Sparassis crispa]GBE77518.1 hypothetical protein SCP_0103930 [Sparassis crispa]
MLVFLLFYTRFSEPTIAWKDPPEDGADLYVVLGTSTLSPSGGGRNQLAPHPSFTKTQGVLLPSAVRELVASLYRGCSDVPVQFWRDH